MKSFTFIYFLILKMESFMTCVTMFLNISVEDLFYH